MRNLIADRYLIITLVVLILAVAAFLVIGDRDTSNTHTNGRNAATSGSAADSSQKVQTPQINPKQPNGTEGSISDGVPKKGGAVVTFVADHPLQNLYSFSVEFIKGEENVRRRVFMPAGTQQVIEVFKDLEAGEWFIVVDASDLPKPVRVVITPGTDEWVVINVTGYINYVSMYIDGHVIDGYDRPVKGALISYEIDLGISIPGRQDWIWSSAVAGCGRSIVNWVTATGTLHAEATTDKDGDFSIEVFPPCPTIIPAKAVLEDDQGNSFDVVLKRGEENVIKLPITGKR